MKKIKFSLIVLAITSSLTLNCAFAAPTKFVTRKQLADADQTTVTTTVETGKPADQTGAPSDTSTTSTTTTVTPTTPNVPATNAAPATETTTTVVTPNTAPENPAPSTSVTTTTTSVPNSTTPDMDRMEPHHNNEIDGLD